MIERMIIDVGIDRRRVFVVGLSAGGAMASAMLAVYPDVFAGGAIIAGLPFASATNVQEAFEVMAKGRERAGPQWGDRVRSASDGLSFRETPRPRDVMTRGDAHVEMKGACVAASPGSIAGREGNPMAHAG
jgi:pimeloyl-ACP methyl ester carboxylesterase